LTIDTKIGMALKKLIPLDIIKRLCLLPASEELRA